MAVLKVLIVEDDSAWRDILEDDIRNALKGIGHGEDTIMVVKTFDEASKALKESFWHLLITDIALGNSSIARRDKLGNRLVERAQNRKIPVIAVSGTPVVNTQDVRNLLKVYKAADFFSKGKFDSKNFITKVQELLQESLQSLRTTKEMNSNYPIRILFLASDPSNETRLRLGQELRDIQHRLQLAKQRENFVLEQRMSVRPGDISQAILDVEPQIVHFSGHGMDTGELCFENEVGERQPVQPDALAALFKLVDEQVKCVVLNACHSEIQAKAIANHIEFVIGMNQAIGDKAAIAFAVGFYKALGANRPIEKAYEFGCAEIQLEDPLSSLEHLTPVLYKEKT